MKTPVLMTHFPPTMMRDLLQSKDFFFPLVQILWHLALVQGIHVKNS